MLNKIWAGMILLAVITAAFTGNMSALGTQFISSSEEAVSIILTLLGVVALWTGLMEIAEDSGLMKKLTRGMRPVLRWLFPDIPDGHPAGQHISANFVANLFGLGWAATPPGLLAMESLSDLNRHSKTASNAMCTFMVVNMSSLQLIPINMIAYRSQYGSANPSMIVAPALIATIFSTVVAVIAAKLMEKYWP
ncbi:MAG: nucleoside recognition protein [Firmicutes bacterium]|nr:nucleoside recognition protein [Bacillota bacterium]